MSLEERNQVLIDLWQQHTDETLVLEGNILKVCGQDCTMEFQPSADMSCIVLPTKSLTRKQLFHLLMQMFLYLIWAKSMEVWERKKTIHGNLIQRTFEICMWKKLNISRSQCRLIFLLKQSTRSCVVHGFRGNQTFRQAYNRWFCRKAAPWADVLRNQCTEEHIECHLSTIYSKRCGMKTVGVLLITDLAFSFCTKYQRFIFFFVNYKIELYLLKASLMQNYKTEIT